MPPVLVAFYGMFGIISTLVSFGKMIAGLAGGTVPDPLVTVLNQLATLTEEAVQTSKEILALLSQLDKEVFGNVMADKLADADQAAVALADWKQNQSAASQEQALNTSVAGLAGMVEEYNLNNYPGQSMVVVLGRVFLTRLAVLKVFPTRRTAADTAQLKAALQYLTASTDTIANTITAENQVGTTTQHATLPGRPPVNMTIVNVAYSNILGDKVYKQSVEKQGLEVPQADVQPLIDAANAVRAQGLQEDLDHFQVTNLRQIIADATPIVG